MQIFIVNRVLYSPDFCGIAWQSSPSPPHHLSANLLTEQSFTATPSVGIYGFSRHNSVFLGSSATLSEINNIGADSISIKFAPSEWQLCFLVILIELSALEFAELCTINC